jgi:hypothetical protein
VTALSILAAFIAGFGGCRILHLLAFRSIAWRLRVLPLMSTSLLSAQQTFGFGNAVVQRFLNTYWPEVVEPGGGYQEMQAREVAYFESLDDDSRILFQMVTPIMGACATLYGAHAVTRALGRLRENWLTTQAAVQRAKHHADPRLDAVFRRVFPE